MKYAVYGLSSVLLGWGAAVAFDAGQYAKGACAVVCAIFIAMLSLVDENENL